MKKFIFSIMMMLTLGVNNSISYAQDIKREGNTFSSVKPSKSTTPPTKTVYTWKDSKGKSYPIYISSTGSCFVIKVSQKTGKEYRQYLGAEISTQISKEMGIKYQPKTKK